MLSVPVGGDRNTENEDASGGDGYTAGEDAEGGGYEGKAEGGD